MKVDLFKDLPADVPPGVKTPRNAKTAPIHCSGKLILAVPGHGLKMTYYHRNVVGL